MFHLPGSVFACSWHGRALVAEQDSRAQRSMPQRRGALLLVLGCCARALAEDSRSNGDDIAPLVALITPLVALARDGTDDQKTQAARKLAILARDEDNQLAIAEAGGIAPLAALARGTDEQETFAAAALQHAQRAVLAVPQPRCPGLLGRTRQAPGCAPHSSGAPQPLRHQWLRMVLPAACAEFADGSAF